MLVRINQENYELPERACLADAIALLQPRTPFAAAVNLRYVPRPEYAQTVLHANDHVEIISPVTGG